VLGAIYERAALSLNSARGFGQVPGSPTAPRERASSAGARRHLGLVGCARFKPFFLNTVRSVAANPSLKGRRP